MIKILLRKKNIPSYFLFLLLTTYGYGNKALGNTNRQTPKITLTENNIPLRDLFKKINEQTGLQIDNNAKETQLNASKKISVNFIQADINEVMTFLLTDKPYLTYALNDKTILIRKKNKNPIISDTTANTIQVVGEITDNDGNAISGATIKVKNNDQGTITNSDGSFFIPNIKIGQTIIISSIGFESKEITVGTKKISISLNSHTNLLDEKVVIAYGSTTKRLNTGNVSSLKAKDIETQPVNGPLIALQGRTPGVFIQQTSGLPGAGAVVRIQGVNSMANGNDPFYVVDGVPYTPQLLPTSNFVNGTSGVYNVPGNPLNYLNNADIESIEVLKDADATAIYGSRAANGAILITTKKGKSGPARMNLTIQNGWSKVGRMMDVLNTREYIEMRREALKNDNASVSPFDWDLNGTWDTTRDVNWQKELIGGTAKYTDAQFSLSGGNTSTQYLLGAGYHKETTVYPGSFSDKKGTVHLNLNSTSADKKLKVQFTGSFLFDDNELPSTDLTSIAIKLAPVAPDYYNSNGTINWMPDANGATTYFNNPIAPNAQKSNNKTTNLISNAILSYEIARGLVVKSSFGYNSLLTSEIFRSPSSIYAPEYRPFISNSSTFITNRISSWIVEPQIEYKQKISKGDINMLIGSTLTQLNKDQQSVSAYGFNNELVLEDLSSATGMYGSTINSVYKYNALYGRITYNWLDKYLLNLTARRDGSSRFGSENQFHNFGAIGAAWIFSQEPYIQSSFPILSFGKLRGSFGTTGSDQIPDYLYMDTYQPIRITGNSYQGQTGLSPTRLTNPYLQWEETKKIQIGLELGFIKDKILLTTNYNYNRSNNQLTYARLATTTGFFGISRNFPAVVQNTGWEIMLTTTNIQTKHFYWTTNFNVTIPKNQLLSYYGQDKNTSIAIGKPLSSVPYFDYVGINDTTGKYQFRDSKGGITTSPSDPIDRIVAMNTDPKFYGGLQNSLSYKGIMLDFFFLFVKKSGFDEVSYGLQNVNYPGVFSSGTGNQSTFVLNRWREHGDKSDIQPYSAGQNTDLNFITNSNAIIKDASLIRLKNVALSWQLPERWKKDLHLQNAKIFINSQNIFTITKYRGLDPETGISLPPLRTISIGAQITL